MKALKKDTKLFAKKDLVSRTYYKYSSGQAVISTPDDYDFYEDTFKYFMFKS